MMLLLTHEPDGPCVGDWAALFIGQYVTAAAPDPAVPPLPFPPVLVAPPVPVPPVPGWPPASTPVPPEPRPMPGSGELE